MCRISEREGVQNRFRGFYPQMHIFFQLLLATMKLGETCSLWIFEILILTQLAVTPPDLEKFPRMWSSSSMTSLLYHAIAEAVRHCRCHGNDPLSSLAACNRRSQDFWIMKKLGAGQMWPFTGYAKIMLRATVYWKWQILSRATRNQLAGQGLHTTVIKPYKGGAGGLKHV